ncbi:MAG: DUF4340 domain-containing protein [Treponema sp.]|jgi:hypothetical protein|nr:DUF4340 domain-containing protein [Treponema sp.]
MSKKLVFIIGMVILLAALGLTLVLLRREAPVTASALPELPPVEYLINYRGEEFAGLASVTVRNDKGEFSIVPGDPPSVSGWESLITSTYPLSRILDVCAGLISQSVVAEDAADLSIYGLDRGRARVEIKTNRGDETTLYVGNEAPDKSSVYARLEGSSQVHQVGKWDTDNLLLGLFDFVDKEVSPPLSNDESGSFEFSEITLGGTVRPDGLIRVVPAGPEEAAVKSRISSLYRIVSPVEESLNIDKGLPILQAIPNIQADAVIARVSRPEDLAPYGLDKPYSTAAVSGTLGQGLGGFALRASRADADGNVYIYREGSELVYQVAASKLAWLTTSWWDLMDKMIILPFIDEVARVEVTGPRRRAAFDLSGQEDELKVEAEGVVLNTDDFRKFYQTLLGAIYDEYAEEKIPAASAPVLEIVYHYRNGQTTDRVSFYPAGSRRVLSSLNGRRPFYTYEAYVEWVFNGLDSILQGKKVQPYL